MNTNKFILTGLAALAFTGAASSQTVVNITGATAFRSAANTSIIALLGGSGVTEFAFDTTTGASAGATNRAIYRGTVAGITGTVIVRASLPGFTRENIDVEIHDGVLTIKAERTDETEERGENYFQRERRIGAVARSIALPSVVDDTQTAAELKDGVLTLRIPKSEKALPKKVKIG